MSVCLAMHVLYWLSYLLALGDSFSGYKMGTTILVLCPPNVVKKDTNIKASSQNGVSQDLKPVCFHHSWTTTSFR